MFAPVPRLCRLHRHGDYRHGGRRVLALTLWTRTITDSPVPAAWLAGLVLLVIGGIGGVVGWRERVTCSVRFVAGGGAPRPPRAAGRARGGSCAIGLWWWFCVITTGVATSAAVADRAVVTAVVTVCGILPLSPSECLGRFRCRRWRDLRVGRAACPGSG